jgi:hypothetical protein
MLMIAIYRLSTILDPKYQCRDLCRSLQQISIDFGRGQWGSEDRAGRSQVEWYSFLAGQSN